jgi:hypothetical protein
MGLEEALGVLRQLAVGVSGFKAEKTTSAASRPLLLEIKRRAF